jgi:hypothetical protein
MIECAAKPAKRARVDSSLNVDLARYGALHGVNAELCHDDRVAEPIYRP